MDIDLQVYHLLHVLLNLVGILIHQLLQGLALDKFPGNGPFTIHHGHTQNLRHMQAGQILDAGSAEGFVQDLSLGESFAEFLDGKVAVAVNTFRFATGN